MSKSVDLTGLEVVYIATDLDEVLGKDFELIGACLSLTACLPKEPYSMVMVVGDEQKPMKREDFKEYLRISKRKANKWLNTLIAAGLIAETNGGDLLLSPRVGYRGRIIPRKTEFEEDSCPRKA